MTDGMDRREFVRLAAVGGALGLASSGLPAMGSPSPKAKLISPGCRRSRVKVARLYVGVPKAHYPKSFLQNEAYVGAPAASPVF